MLIKLAVRTALLLSFGFLCACGPKDNKELAANDSYQIELKSPPAKTSTQRHVLGLSVTTRKWRSLVPRARGFASRRKPPQ